MPIQAVKGQGYQIPGGLDLLSDTKIQNALPLAVKNYWKPIIVLANVPSTNDYLLKDRTGIARVCCAEQQTAGRGRQGRTWFSPFGYNVYLSVKWHFAGSLHELPGLSLCIGIAVAKALQHYGVINPKVKWPNDLWVNNAKLGGILIDVHGDTAGPCDVVIGIGINGRMSHLQEVPIEKRWTDIDSLTGQRLARNQLIAEILKSLYSALNEFQTVGLSACVEAWGTWDALAGHTIEVKLPHEQFEGTVQGINAQGQLILETSQGERHLRSGEVSLSHLGN